jgi:hypothetical protein
MSTTISDYELMDDLNEQDWNDYRSQLQERYAFYIMNPDQTKGVEYSFWIREGEYEYPILSSNTGGFATFTSRHDSVGDHIKPTVEFLSLVGYGVHEAMSFMPDLYFQTSSIPSMSGSNHFKRTVERTYDGKEREYEVWTAELLIQQFTMSEGLVVPELRPLAVWASKHTEFGVPALSDGDSD